MYSCTLRFRIAPKGAKAVRRRSHLGDAFDTNMIIFPHAMALSSICGLLMENASIRVRVVRYLYVRHYIGRVGDDVVTATRLIEDLTLQ